MSTQKKNRILICANVIIAIAIAVILMGCGDTIEQPAATDEIQDTQEPNYQTSFNLQKDEPQIPEIIHTTPKPDPNEADKPLEPLIIDVDKSVNDDINDIEKNIGEPVEIVTVENRPTEIRYYLLKDGCAMDIMIRKLKPTMITIYYRRGYPTSIDALKAAGFKENQIALQKQIPKRNEGNVNTIAQHIYSAKTDKKEYQAISVFQNQHGLWSIVAFFM